MAWRTELEKDKPPVKQQSGSVIFLITVPEGKVVSLKNIVGVLGGEITEM